ncbi:Small ribosomal subunit protein [Trichinella spiralis]|uniref:Small ribosomal subunit protein n=1 Tax=Trichinella spiralis TaxID=6334 RepID=A0ABR3K7L9_TRISP
MLAARVQLVIKITQASFQNLLALFSRIGRGFDIILFKTGCKRSSERISTGVAQECMMPNTEDRLPNITSAKPAVMRCSTLISDATECN